MIANHGSVPSRTLFWFSAMESQSVCLTLHLSLLNEVDRIRRANDSDAEIEKVRKADRFSQSIPS